VRGGEGELVQVAPSPRSIREQRRRALPTLADTQASDA
jgi:hypothetical protein